MLIDDFPIIESFRISRLQWDVSDFRNIEHGERLKAMHRWTQAVIESNEKQGIDRSEILCEFASKKHESEFDRRLSRALRMNPDLDPEEYRRTNPPKRFRFHSGLDRPATLLSVSLSDKIIGGIYCSNMVIEEDTPENVTARSMIWVGVEPIPEKTELDCWMEAIEFMIDNDLRLEDGRVLDFVGYDFMSDEHLKDGISRRETLTAFLSRMDSAFDSSGTPDASTGDVLFRRRGSRPAPEGGG